MRHGNDWPELSESRDGPTIATLHRFSQVAGKAAVALLPWRNHGWHLTLHVHPRGFRTEPLYGPNGPFELGFDLVDHAFTFSDRGAARRLALTAMPVADFHRRVLALLTEAGHPVEIHAAPNEIDPATPFAEDIESRPYEPDSASRLLGALLSADRVLRLFRSGFLGKVSPVHFFWGSFDLAVTRFSGRTAPPHPGGIPHLPDDVTREAYSHEVSSAGFWPGGANGGAPLFYSYAYRRPTASPTSRWRRSRRAMTARSASSCSTMTRSGEARIRTPPSSPSWKGATPPPPIWAAGTGTRSNVRAACRGGRGRFSRRGTGRARSSSASR